MQLLFADVVFSHLAMHLLLDRVLHFFCPWRLPLPPPPLDLDPLEVKTTLSLVEVLVL